MTERVSAAFISYSRDDSEFAFRLARDLKAAGASVWLDQIDIPPGKPWDNAIEDALYAAQLMLLILSPDSARSANVRNEISFALEEGKTVIPVLYKDCRVPLQLQRNNRVDFRADYARGLASLLANLQLTQPDNDVLTQAADDDAKRRAAWQAREAEAQRLKVREQEQQRNQRAGEEALKAAEERSRIEAERPAAAAETNGRWELEDKGLPRIAAQPEAKETSLPSANALPLNPHLFRSFGGQPTGDDKVSFGSEKDTAPPKRNLLWFVLAAVLLVIVAIPAVIWGTKSYRFYQEERTAKKEKQDLDESCKKGDAKDCDALGNLYEAGMSAGFSRDFPKAASYFQLGCDRGDANSCCSLGIFYQFGEHGMIQDAPKAAAFYEKACAANSAYGCSFLATLYDGGLGVPMSSSKALELHKKACTIAGNKPGCDL